MAVRGIRLSQVAPPHKMSTVRDIIEPALPMLCKEFGMHHAEIWNDPVSDNLQLVVIDSKGRRYLHPRFVTRQEIMDQRWIDLVRPRFESAINGCPAFYSQSTPVMASPSFSLDEIEQAQDIVDSLK